MFVFFGNHFFVLTTFKTAIKHMVLPFRMKGDVMSGHFLMIWFLKDSLDTVGFRTFGGSRAVLSNSNRGILHVFFQEIAIYRTKTVNSPKPTSDIRSPKCAFKL